MTNPLTLYLQLFAVKWTQEYVGGVLKISLSSSSLSYGNYEDDGLIMKVLYVYDNVGGDDDDIFIAFLRDEDDNINLYR